MSMEIAEQLAFLLAGTLFLIGVWQQFRPGRAAFGNRILGVAVTLAILTILFQVAILTLPEILGALVAGTLIGQLWAQRARQSATREAAFSIYGISGSAAMLVGLSDYWSRQMERNMLPDGAPVFADGVAILLGGMAFAGSVLAWAKSTNRMGVFRDPGASLRALSVFLLVASLCLCGVLVPYPEYYSSALAVAVISLLLGITTVLPVQKHDLGSIAHLLGACSGLAAAGVGFSISSEIVVAGGALLFGVNLAQVTGAGQGRKRGIWRVLGGR